MNTRPVGAELFQEDG